MEERFHSEGERGDAALRQPVPDASQPSGENVPQLRGLYRHVKISVRTLDFVIVAGIAAMVLLVLWSSSGGGYTIRFDARGGSDVPSQTVPYGEPVAEPEPPERTGYLFDGWYLDESGSLPWDFVSGRVEGETTLYARWIPEPPSP